MKAKKVSIIKKEPYPTEGFLRGPQKIGAILFLVLTLLSTGKTRWNIFQIQYENWNQT